MTTVHVGRAGPGAPPPPETGPTSNNANTRRHHSPDGRHDDTTGDEEFLWITQSFIPSNRARVAAYAVLDFTWTMTRDQVYRTKPWITTERVVGALVQHRFDRGRVDMSRVVWAIQHPEWSETIVPIDSWDAANIEFIDVCAPDELPDIPEAITQVLRNEVADAVDRFKAARERHRLRVGAS